MCEKKGIGEDHGNDDTKAPDAARAGRAGEASRDARGQRPQDAAGDSREADGDGDNGTALVAEALAAKIEGASAEQIVGLLLAGYKSEWRGLLPPPEDYNQYDEETRRSMRVWNDAQIIDASKRSDRIADAEIRQGAREQWLSFIINALFARAAFAAFVLTRDPASLTFLAVPGVTIAVNLYQGRRDR